MGLHPQEIVDLVTLTEKFLDEKFKLIKFQTYFDECQLELGISLIISKLIKIDFELKSE